MRQTDSYDKSVWDSNEMRDGVMKCCMKVSCKMSLEKQNLLVDLK